MFLQALKVVCVSLVFTSVSAFASGGEGHGGGAEGGGHEGAAPAPKEIKSDEESYNVVFARVQGLEAKVQSGKAEIEKLILEKQHTTDQTKVNEIIKTMLTLHKDLAKNLKEYDQQRALLKYRYPEKGQTTKREYERIELKSIEDMESQMSLGATIKRTMKKVRSQYNDPQEQQEAAAKEEKAHAEKNPSGGNPGLTDAVILKK